MEKSESGYADSVAIAADIVSAYVAHNSVPASGLSDLIHIVHASLSKLCAASAAATPDQEVLVPAVSVRKSITTDYLICLDDGKKFKSLKRHLTSLGMTADQYRQKWNLPNDYPMVAHAYSSRRSELAKKIGLGQLRKAKDWDARSVRWKRRPHKKASSIGTRVAPADDAGCGEGIRTRAGDARMACEGVGWPPHWLSNTSGGLGAF